MSKQTLNSQPNDANWMLYGCYGYSGELILNEAIRKGLKPIVAGRCKEKTKAQADKYGLAYRVFSLDNQQDVEANIQDLNMVFNAAGPYTSTCLPLLKACLTLKVHNLSLAGEIPILEELYGYDQAAKEAGILIAVGLGFDVMPTDAMAGKIKSLLPDANRLLIGLDGPNDMSRGSMKEFFEQIGEQPFWIRKNGKLVPSKPKTKRLDFGNGVKLASGIAWGDTASAYHSTGIPNIEVYSSVSLADLILIKSLNACSFLFKSKRVQSALNTCIDKFLSGPDEAKRELSQTYLFAEGKNEAGKTVRLEMTTPSAYKITYLGAVKAIEHVLSLSKETSGYYTPAQLLGEAKICAIDGVSEIRQLN